MALCFRFTSSTFSEILSMKPRISSTCTPRPPVRRRPGEGARGPRGWTRLGLAARLRERLDQASGGGATWAPRLQGLPVYSRTRAVLAPTCSKNSSMKPSRSTVTVTSSSSSLSLACAGVCTRERTCGRPTGTHWTRARELPSVHIQQAHRLSSAAPTTALCPLSSVLGNQPQ